MAFTYAAEKMICISLHSLIQKTWRSISIKIGSKNNLGSGSNKLTNELKLLNIVNVK